MDFPVIGLARILRKPLRADSPIKCVCVERDLHALSRRYQLYMIRSFITYLARISRRLIESLRRARVSPKRPSPSWSALEIGSPARVRDHRGAGAQAPLDHFLWRT